MPSINSSIQNILPLDTASRSLRESHFLRESESESNLKAAVINAYAVITLDHTRPLHTRFIEQTSTSFKPGLKAVILATIAFLGTAGIYCARKVFGDSDPISLDALSKVERTGSDISHHMVRVRALPTALPLEDQVVLPGTLFQVSHEFFTDADDGFIQQKIAQGPSWLTSQFNPIVSNYSTSGAVYQVQVVGNIAYVASRTSGLQIINITTLSRPTLIGTYLGTVYGVQVVGNIAYVADSSSGLQIINIATPSKPTLIGTYDTPGQSYEVQVVGTTAYVADYNGGLQIINITKPNSPTLIGTYFGTAYGVQVVGTTAYVAGGDSSFTIINITTPSKPTLIGTYAFSGVALGVQVVGTTAYVVDEDSGLQIINITKPSKPTLIGTYLGAVNGVQIVGNIVYVTGGTSGLHIINITKPSSPNLIATYDTPGQAYGIQVVGTTAYVADMNSGLQILSGLNRLKLSGTASALDQSNYMVTLIGTTTTGTTSTSFTLSVGGNIAPVYQNPISIQQTSVDKSFNYIMPDNVFVDPNGDAMTYRVKDLPHWLVFELKSRTFSGKPTSGDTGTYTDRSTIVTVIASDGQLETAGQFTVTVTGDSYLVKIIRVGLPILSGLGTAYSGYKNRALFLNQIAKRKWRNNQMRVRLGEDFIYELKTNAKHVQKVQAYVKDQGCLGKLTEKILCGKQRHIALAWSLPTWMGYNPQVNMLYSMRKLEEIDLLGYRNMQIRVLSSGGVIKELLHVTLEGDASSLDGTFDSLARQERIGLLLFPTTMANSIEMDGFGTSNDVMDKTNESVTLFI